MFSREQLDKISRPLLWLKKRYACEHNMEATCNWQFPACCWVFSAHGGCPRPWKVPFPICNHLCNILSSHDKCENTEQISFGKGHSQNSKSGASSQSWTGSIPKKHIIRIISIPKPLFLDQLGPAWGPQDERVSSIVDFQRHDTSLQANFWALRARTPYFMGTADSPQQEISLARCSCWGILKPKFRK